MSIKKGNPLYWVSKIFREKVIGEKRRKMCKKA
jgi:hypothetical protein